jgi:hypothetical protein
MSRYVVFHNRVIVHPGAEAYTDLSGMVQPGVDVSRVAAVVGTAPWGQPGVVHAFSDHNTARQYFGDSDLADAIELLMNPSNDSRVDGGAVLVYAYKTDRSTLAERWLLRDPETGVFPPASGSPVKNVVIQGTIEQTANRVDATVLDDVTPAQLVINNDSYSENEFAGLVVEILSGPGKGQQRFIESSLENPNDSSEYILVIRDDQDWDVLPYNSTYTSTFRIAAPQVKFYATDYGEVGNDYSFEFGRQPVEQSYELQMKEKRRTIHTKNPFGGLRAPSFKIKVDPTGGGTLAEWTNTANWAIPQAFDSSNAVEGITASASTSATVLDASASNLTASAHIDRWVVITGPENLGASTANTTFSDVNPTTGGHGGGAPWASAGTTITFPTAASAVDDYYNGWYVSVTNDNGTTIQYMRIVDYVGSTRVATVEGGEGDWAFAPDSISSNNDINLYEPVTNPFLGKMYKILSHTASGGGAGSGDDVTLAGVGLGSAPTSPLLEWKVIQATDAYIEIEGQDGAAKTFTVKIRDRTAGTPIQTIASVSLETYNTLGTLESKLDGISGIYSEVGDGISRDADSARFDFGQLSDHYGRNISSILPSATGAGSSSIVLQKSDDFPDPSSYGDYWVRIAPGTTREELFLVTTNTTGTETLASTSSSLEYDHAANTVVEFYRGSQIFGGPSDESFVVRDNAQKLVEYVGSQVGVVSAERATSAGYSGAAPGYSGDAPNWNQMIGAAQPEDNLDVFKKLQGGDRGTSVVSIPANDSDPHYPVSWEDALDKFLMIPSIRVLTAAVSEDLDSWSAGDIDIFINMFKNHLLDSEENKTERQGYLGLKRPLEAGTYGTSTFDMGLLETIRFLNEERMSVSGQMAKVITASGEKTLDPWAFSMLCAGIQMGTDLGEPITFKQCRASELSSPYNDWNPRRKADYTKALMGGLLYGEPKNGIWRIVRGFTTHVSSNNLARTDINVWEIRNHVQRVVRDGLEARFIGRGVGNVRPGVRFSGPANIQSIRTYVATLLNNLRSEGYIIDSQDENGNYVNAWQDLGVKIVGDVGYVRFRVYPKTGLNFILIDIGFQLPSFSA